MKEIILNKKPWCPEGWTIESNEEMASFDPSELTLHLEPEQEKGSIKGEILAERMKGKGLNSNVLRQLLDNPKLIPKKWEEKTNGHITWIYFWGTIFRLSDGDRYVLYLCWYSGRWIWSMYWLEYDWSVDSPSAVLASSLNSDPKPPESFESLDLSSAIKICKEAGLTVTKTY